MKKKVNDGWHICAGQRVYVENGCVKRGITKDGTRPLYPYRPGKYEGWDLDQSMTLDTFRREYKAGNILMS